MSVQIPPRPDVHEANDVAASDGGAGVADGGVVSLADLPEAVGGAVVFDGGDELLAGAGLELAVVGEEEYLEPDSMWVSLMAELQVTSFSSEAYDAAADRRIAERNERAVCFIVILESLVESSPAVKVVVVLCCGLRYSILDGEKGGT
eukprot:CAMPEP_0171418190 /NCGR_PEP_ID=MMETSP0880-20121228/40981_1 /TAXON_ID=67004 /ORGANISM="Thalassiosira weissflogii, Strain CCMP1336" /LENGTH=147 /DNA_ID=CAMNT_0011936461 /DNA_START=771 /DNA_END=1215 /DNA_ORIENTATION=+